MRTRGLRCADRRRGDHRRIDRRHSGSLRHVRVRDRSPRSRVGQHRRRHGVAAIRDRWLASCSTQPRFSSEQAAREKNRPTETSRKARSVAAKPPSCCTWSAKLRYGSSTRPLSVRGLPKNLRDALSRRRDAPSCDDPLPSRTAWNASSTDRLSSTSRICLTWPLRSAKPR